jgi:glycine/serine hydroxymethyltransferase
MTKVSTSVAAGMPASIHCIGPAWEVFPAAAVHIRQGMVFHPDRIVEMFPNGTASFYLVQGNPTQAAIDMARAANEQALQLQLAEYEADVKRAAQAMMEQAKRDEIAKQMAEVQAAHEKAVAKLKREAEAELAKLSQ